MIAGMSPPGPLRCGSRTCSTKPVATAASNALPPFSRMLIPTAEAIQWVEVTTPNVPRISGRVVNVVIFLSFGISMFTWIEGIPQAIAQQIKTDYHEENGSPWPHGHPGCL